jgi:hypothetical protein
MIEKCRYGSYQNMEVIGVRITTRQLTKYEQTSGLVSNNTNPLTSQARVSSPLTDPFYIFVQLFSVLANKNTGLLASLARVLKNVSTPLK